MKKEMGVPRPCRSQFKNKLKKEEEEKKKKTSISADFFSSAVTFFFFNEGRSMSWFEGERKKKKKIFLLRLLRVLARSRDLSLSLHVCYTRLIFEKAVKLFVEWVNRLKLLKRKSLLAK